MTQTILKAVPEAAVSVPPEWAAMTAMWTAFPSHADLWRDGLTPARREVAAMIAALADEGLVRVLAMGDEAMAAAEKMLPAENVEVIPAQFGDIWLRDTGPIFMREDGKKIAATFRFNGWGEKYILPHDDKVSAFIAQKSKAPVRRNDFVLEGGAIETDGQGCILTTRQCLLNPNRNPALSEQEIERHVKEAFGANRLVWLDEGLLGDHTDGHIDNIARFAAPGHVICQSPSGPDDPNAETLDAIARTLESEDMKVTRIPSPGLILDTTGEPAAASHMNYIIFNNVIALPVYEKRHGEAAAEALRAIFPGRRVVALPAHHILTGGGGGSFHCITQQEFA